MSAGQEGGDFSQLTGIPQFLLRREGFPEAEQFPVETGVQVVCGLGQPLLQHIHGRVQLQQLFPDVFPVGGHGENSITCCCGEQLKLQSEGGQ